jgi:hypothetical protein
MRRLQPDAEAAMVRGSIGQEMTGGDGAIVALLGSVAVALASTTLLLAAPELLQALRALSMPGIAPL